MLPYNAPKEAKMRQSFFGLNYYYFYITKK